MARDLPAVKNGGKTVKTGRDALGRFTTGGPPGPGRPVANPFGRYQTELRQALLAQVRPGDLRAVMRKVLQLAKRGNLAAAELVLRWSLGGPPPVVDPDRVDEHELSVRRGRPTLVDAMTLTDEPADREPAADAPDAEDEPDDPRESTSPPLRTVLSWAIEELAQAKYALQTQRPPPPPDPAPGWARFAAQRLEFDPEAATELEGLYLTYLRWCAGHGEVAWEEAPVLAALQARGATLHTGPLSQVRQVVGVRVVE
jgi:hypothetical protein